MEILNIETMRSQFPALFATAPAAHVSKDYKFVSTEQIITKMAEADWHPVQVKAPKFRSEGKRETGRHVVMFRNPTIEADSRLGGLFPCVRSINSHDWSTRLDVLGGMFRSMCSNGLWVASSDVAQFSVRHDNAIEDIGVILSRMIGFTEQVMDKVRRWNTITLSDSSALQFAERAARLRFGDKVTPEVTREILTPMRAEDAEPTLWATFNRAQENLMRGGFRAPNMRRAGRTRRARSIINIDAERKLNEGLWSLAEEYATA